MRILFDGTCISEHSAGIGTYAYQLLQGLARRQETYKVTVLCKRESNIPQGNNIEKRVINNRFLKLLPIDVEGRGERYDIYHQPNYIPHCFRGKKIVTIHDMSHKVYPQYHPWRRVMMLRLFEDRLKKADVILTVSEFSKREIIKYLKVRGEKIHVTYLGVADIYSTYQGAAEEGRMLREGFHIPKEYLLYVGTIEPRKNIERLIQAFALYKRQTRSEIKLVMAGGIGWLCKSIFDIVKNLKLQNEIVFTGYFPEALKPALYAQAKALVYPSLYEGFGLPIVEAMAVGNIVLTSNVTSLPEVAGEAGIYFDPSQTEEITEKIALVLQGDFDRKKYEILSKQQAKKFSWHKCVEQTIQCYA